MSLKIGIVGLPNVGKSTLFNGLTKKSVPAANYPFCTIDPSVGVVAVPDRRLVQLAAFSNSARVVPAAVEFVDIAGLVKGASEGAGLGNQFLQHIREVDAILEVVRIFEDENVIHVDGAIDPKRDIEVINLELALSDLQIVTKRLESIARDAKRGDKAAVIEEKILQKYKTALSEGKRAATVELEDEEREVTLSVELLTTKPILYGLNKKTGGHNLDEMNDDRFHALIDYLESEGAKWIVIDAKTEEEFKDLTEEERQLFQSDVGKREDGIDELIQAGYALLNLITFFTTGEDETRAWTIHKGDTAKEAGAAIHTDFKDKFIRAEVIHWDTLLASGSYGKAREKGEVRTEGKEYIVVDGDVIEFKI